MIGCAAASQQLAIIGGPIKTLIRIAMSGPTIAPLATVDRANVAEALHEAGEQGVHVKELAKANGVEADKLGQLARCVFSL